MVAEVIEEVYDVVVSPDFIVHLLETAHAVQDVELLPPLGEVDLPVYVVWVSQVDERQVLQDQTSEGDKGRRQLLY